MWNGAGAQQTDGITQAMGEQKRVSTCLARRPAHGLTMPMIILKAALPGGDSSPNPTLATIF